MPSLPWGLERALSSLRACPRGAPEVVQDQEGCGVSYQTDLLDPRWQRKRLEIFQRDDFQCLRCGATDKPVTVHHRSYHGRPWECPEFDLETLCQKHHMDEHKREDGRPILFTLRQMIARAHSAGNWDEVWRLCHLVESDKDT